MHTKRPVHLPPLRSANTGGSQCCVFGEWFRRLCARRCVDGLVPVSARCNGIVGWNRFCSIRRATHGPNHLANQSCFRFTTIFTSGLIPQWPSPQVHPTKRRRHHRPALTQFLAKVGGCCVVGKGGSRGSETEHAFSRGGGAALATHGPTRLATQHASGLSFALRRRVRRPCPGLNDGEMELWVLVE